MLAWSRRQFRQGLIFLMLAAMPAVQLSANPAVSEYAVKAALLIKLSRFVYLPDENAEKEPRLCILGQNPFGDELEQLNQASDWPYQISLLSSAGGAQTDTCDFVFISRSERRRLAAILKQLADYPLVTISDIQGFARNGGMVELAFASRRDSQISIIINRPAARQQQIEFNAQLLRLAVLINE